MTEPSRTGAGGESAEAIAVEIVAAIALESAAPSTRADGGAAGSSAEASGIPAAAPSQPQAPQTPRASIEMPTEPADTLPPLPEVETETPDQAAAVAARDVAHRPREAQREPATEPIHQPAFVPPDTGADLDRREAAETTSASGASARAAADMSLSEAAAAARSGVHAHYALEVRMAVGRARARHPGLRGNVVVTFALDEAGAMRDASVVTSSGRPALDAEALRLISAARFPTPPQALSASQRTFVVTVEFR